MNKHHHHHHHALPLIRPNAHVMSQPTHSTFSVSLPISRECPQERKRESERASERARVKDLCQTSQLCCFAVYYYNPTISLSTLLKRETDRRGPVPLRGHHQQQQAYEVVFWTLCLPRVLNERTWIVFKYREAIL